MEENSGPTDKKATNKTPTIKIGDSTYVRKDAIGWVDKKDKTNTPVSPAMARALDQGLAQTQALPVEDKGLEAVKTELGSLETTVKSGDAKEQESLLTLIERVKELNKTMGGVEEGVSTLGDKLKQGTGEGPNEPAMSSKDQIESIKLSIGQILKAAIKGAIGEGSRSGGKFIETYNQLRATPQIEKDPETGKYINKLTGKEHGESDYKEEQEKYNNRPGRLVAAGSSAVAGIGKYFQGVGERLDPTGIVRRFNDIKQDNTDRIKAKEYEEKRLAGLPSSDERQADAKPTLNTGDHMSAQAGVRVTDINQNVITRLADAISKAIKGDAPLPPEPEEVAKDSLPAAANDNAHPDATKVPDESGAGGIGFGILEGIGALWGMLKKVVGDAFEGFMKFGKKIAGEAPEFIGKLWTKVQEVIGDLMGKLGKIFETMKNGITNLFKGGEKITGDVVKGGEGLLKGGEKMIAGAGEKGLLKTGAEAATKVGVKGGLRAIPLLGAGISAAWSGYDEYQHSGNLAKAGFVGLGSGLGTLGGQAIGAAAGGVGEIPGAIGGGMLGEYSAGALWDKGAEFFSNFGGQKKPANTPIKPAVTPKTAAVAGMTNKNAAMKEQAASSKSSSPVIASDNSSKTTVINNNSNMSMMLPTAADRGSLRLATYT